ncbi:flagellar basal body-associated protein FliL [Rheinheimera sp. 4Y26]|uniref:flagellar basal body-associated protein FliL n=1 Tax=Rheinheimera sp. 4Y26 TaxID=2977811 RepID=UPI0021B09BB0|nr:flagellar basal body-associated protein FliL [Rheinheimera sp. 4Y26]MCT6700586.1 flagellar basal body-associated protein FliL [Rheinheimera sp. 4Y26]
MAAEKDLQIADGGAKKKKMIIIAAAVVVLGAGAGGYFAFSGGDAPEAAPATADAAAAEGEAAPAKAASGELGTALYVSMPRPFVFNVPGASRDRLVQIKVQILVRGTNNEEIAKQHIPLMESTMLRTFSKANADDLVTAAGKDTLKAAALKDVQEALIGVAGSPIVEEILFTGFVMQ